MHLPKVRGEDNMFSPDLPDLLGKGLMGYAPPLGRNLAEGIIQQGPLLYELPLIFHFCQTAEFFMGMIDEYLDPCLNRTPDQRLHLWNAGMADSNGGFGFGR